MAKQETTDDITLNGVEIKSQAKPRDIGEIMELYSDVDYAIKKCSERLSSTSTTVPIAEFYKARKVKKALSDIKLNSDLQDAQGNKFDVNKIQKHLLKNFDRVGKYFERLQSDPANLLIITEKPQLPSPKTAEYKALEACFKQDTREYSKMTSQADVERAVAYKEANPNNKSIQDLPLPIVGELKKEKVTGWALSQQAKFKELLDKLPKTYAYNLVDTSDDLTMSNSSTLYDIYTLCEDIKLPLTSGLGYYTYNDATRGITAIFMLEHRLVRTYVVFTLANLYRYKQDEDKKKAEKSRDITNVRNANEHDVVMQPHTIALTDLIDGALEGRDIKELESSYRREKYESNKEIKASGKWLAHMDSPQTELPIDYGENDPVTHARFMSQAKAKVLTAHHALRRDNILHPDNNGWHKLSDLARLDPNNLRGRGNELKDGAIESMYTGLQLGSMISANYKISTDKKGNSHWQRIYLMERITEFKTNKWGNITHVKVDFTPEYKASGSLNIGVPQDGILELPKVEQKNLWAYLCEKFTQYQTSTVQYKPIKLTATNLAEKAGIYDSNKTRLLEMVQDLLDDLVKRKYIAKYETKNGAKKIRGFDKESQTLLIYPTKTYADMLVTKKQSRAERAVDILEQKARLNALKKYAKGYTDFDVLAKELSVTRTELDSMLAGQQPISDDIIELVEKY